MSSTFHRSMAAAAACAAITLPIVVVALPASAAAPATSHPAAGAVETSAQTLTPEGVDRSALQELREDAAAGALPAVHGEPAVLTDALATRDFNLVGVTWEPDAALGAVSVQVRVRESGAWSAWESLPVEEGGPDPGTAEYEASRKLAATEPLLTDGGDGVQIRVDSASGRSPEGLSVDLVDGGDPVAAAPVGAREPSGGTASAQSVQAAGVAAPDVVTRAQWGADESMARSSSQNSTVKAMTVHHTASSNSYSTKNGAMAQLRSIYAYHTQSQGWADIGYNFVVDKFGNVYEGRRGSITTRPVGAHASGFNTSTMGVSALGNYEVAEPSSAMVTGIAEVVAWKLDAHGVDPEDTTSLTSAGGSARFDRGTTVTLPTVFRHLDVGYTSCPGIYLSERMGSIRTQAARLISSADTPPPPPPPPAEPQPAPVTSPVDAPAPPAVVQGRLAGWTISSRWAALGGERGVLGRATTAERATPAPVTGRYQHFTGGSLYDSPATDASMVRGVIRGRWGALGWERSPLGFPISDERRTPERTGAYNHFQRGSVYWTPDTGAREVRGMIRDRWAALGWERSGLGYPTTGERVTPDRRGAFTQFQRGSIYWTPATGAHELRGTILGRWAAMGWETSALGYPTTSEKATPDRRGRFNHFQGGSVYWTPATGAHEVMGATRDRWASMGWERSALGYPTSRTVPTVTGTTTFFQGGAIRWVAETGATSVELT